MKIKYGSARTVFIFSSFVIKVPRKIFFYRVIASYILMIYPFSVIENYILKGRVRQNIRFISKAILNNKNEFKINRKGNLPFFPRTYFSLFGLFIISSYVEGENIGYRQLIPMFQELSSLDPCFQKNWKKGLYCGHDYYSNDWIKTKRSFVFVDYGHGFGELLAKNQEKVEAILKTEFNKATV